MKFWVGLGSRSIQELRVGSGFSLGLKVWVGLGHKLGKILGLLWVKALVTFRFSGWVGSGFFGFFANSSCNNIESSSVPLSSKVQTRQVFQVQGADIDHVDFEKNMQAMFFVKCFSVSFFRLRYAVWITLISTTRTENTLSELFEPQPVNNATPVRILSFVINN